MGRYHIEGQMVSHLLSQHILITNQHVQAPFQSFLGIVLSRELVDSSEL